MTGRQPSSPAVRLSKALWTLFPLAIGVLAVLLAMAPLRLGGMSLAAPSFALMTLYYFTLYRSEMVPPSSPFLLGLVQDVLIGTPPGLSAVVFLVAYGFAHSQRLFFIAQPIGGEWLGFAFTASIAAATAFLAVSIYHGAFVSPWPFAVQGALSAALYPLFAKLLGILNQRVPSSA